MNMLENLKYLASLAQLVVLFIFFTPFLGVWKLLVWRAAFCFPYPKEVSEVMHKVNTITSETQSTYWSYHIPLHRPSENMLIRANTDGTYSANWTPGAVGLYTIHVTIDGIEIGERV